MNEQIQHEEEKTGQGRLSVGIPDSALIGVGEDFYEYREVKKDSSKAFLTSLDGFLASAEERNKIAENFFQASLERTKEIAEFLIEAGEIDMEDAGVHSDQFIELFKKTYQMVEIENLVSAVKDGIEKASEMLGENGRVCLFRTDGSSGDLFSKMVASLLEDQGINYFESSDLKSDVDNISENDVILVPDDVAYSGRQLSVNLSAVSHIKTVISLGAITEQAFEILNEDGEDNREILFAKKLHSLADLLRNGDDSLIKLAYCYFWGERFELWQTKKLPKFNIPENLNYFDDEERTESLTHLIANLPSREEMLERLESVRAAYTPFKIPDPMSMDSLFATLEKPGGEKTELFHQTLSLYPESI